MAQVDINEHNPYMDRQNTRINSYYLIIIKAQPKFDPFDEQFLGLEAVLDLQNSIKEFLSSSSCLLMHFLTFFWDQKNIDKSRPKA